MWYNCFFALFVLAAILLADFATAAVYWDDMQVKHTWNTVPANWENLGNATAGAMISHLHLALEPYRESALIDALSEVSNPRHPRHVLPPRHSPARTFVHVCCSVSDMVHIYPKNRLPNLSVRTQKRSSSFVAGLYTMAYDPPPSQQHTAAPG